MSHRIGIYFVLSKVYDRSSSEVEKLELENTRISVWVNDEQHGEYRCGPMGELGQACFWSVPYNVLHANDTYLRFELIQDSHDINLVRRGSRRLPFTSVLKNDVEHIARVYGDRIRLWADYSSDDDGNLIYEDLKDEYYRFPRPSSYRARQVEEELARLKEERARLEEEELARLEEEWLAVARAKFGAEADVIVDDEPANAHPRACDRHIVA